VGGGGVVGGGRAWVGGGGGGGGGRRGGGGASRVTQYDHQNRWFIVEIETREVMVNGCIIDHVHILTTNKGGVS
jgi:hypothetical protein